jgi:hypothetical protein
VHAILLHVINLNLPNYIINLGLLTLPFKMFQSPPPNPPISSQYLQDALERAQGVGNAILLHAFHPHLPGSSQSDSDIDFNGIQVHSSHSTTLRQTSFKQIRSLSDLMMVMAEGDLRAVVVEEEEEEAIDEVTGMCSPTGVPIRVLRNFYGHLMQLSDGILQLSRIMISISPSTISSLIMSISLVDLNHINTIVIFALMVSLPYVYILYVFLCLYTLYYVFIFTCVL